MGLAVRRSITRHFKKRLSTRLSPLGRVSERRRQRQPGPERRGQYVSGCALWRLHGRGAPERQSRFRPACAWREHPNATKIVSDVYGGFGGPIVKISCGFTPRTDGRRPNRSSRECSTTDFRDKVPFPHVSTTLFYEPDLSRPAYNTRPARQYYHERLRGRPRRSTRSPCS